MASDINKVFIIGRLTRKPELQSTSSGSAYTRISLASNRAYYTKTGELKQEVHFVDCVAWAKQAETICKYLDKGRRVAIEGSLRYSSWDGEDGKKRSKIEIQIATFQFLDSTSNQNFQDPSSAPIPEQESFSPNQQSVPPKNTSPSASNSSPDFDVNISDDDIPF